MDNGSTDGSGDVLRAFQALDARLRIVSLDRNLGFAGGNNEGLRHVPEDARYVCFLNNDCTVDPGWLAPLVGFLESHPEVAIVQPKLLRLDDPRMLDRASVSVDRLGYDAYNLFEDRLDDPAADRAQEVFSVSGAAFLVRRSALRTFAFEEGAFDPDYFIYFEETDLCWRARLAGHGVWYLPQAQVRHLRGGATRPGRELPPLLVFHHTKNRLAALLKNYGRVRLTLWFPGLLAIETMRSLATWRRKPDHARATLQGIAWVFRNWRRLARRRAFVQTRVRHVSDRVATKGMRAPDFRLLLANFRRVYEGPR